MVTFLPSANVTDAVPGGLGRLLLSCCAYSVAASNTKVKPNTVLRIKLPPGGSTADHESKLSQMRATSYNRQMSAFDNYRDELEQFEFMMGPARGRLAVTMDI